MPDPIRRRWPHMILAVLLILILKPTPTSQSLVQPIEAARVALDSHDVESALSYIQEIDLFEPAFASFSSRALELAIESQAYSWLQENLSSIEEALGVSPRTMCARWLLSFPTEPERVVQHILISEDVTCPEVVPMIEDYLIEQFDQANPENVMPLIEAWVEIHPSDELILRQNLYLATRDIPLAHRGLSNAPTYGHLYALLVRELHPLLEPEGIPSAVDYAQVGRAFAKAELWDLARLTFRTALDIDPENAEARSYYGLALTMSGMEGVPEQDVSIEMDPDLAMAYVFKGLDLKINGNYEEAKHAFEKALELEPTNPGTLAELGSVYAHLGEIENAKSAYLQAAEIGDSDPRFWRLLAEFSLNHELEIATIGIPAARNASVLSDGNPSDLVILGYAHFLNQDSLIAGKILREALSLDPGNARAYYYLGMVLNSSGDHEDALHAFELAIESDPDGQFGDLARRALDTLSR